jgi:hypothetical protein
MSLLARLRRSDRRSLVTALIVGITTMFVVWTMSPWSWFIDTTPTGGDMGAHVWSPAFLRDELLPNFRLTGWSPDWYAGFPAFTFYMIIPSLAIVMVNVGVEFDLGPLQVDVDFYAFVGLVLAASEITRRMRTAPIVRLAAAIGAGAFSIAMSWRYDGRLLDPARVLPWSPIDPFTYNDMSLDLAVAGIALPAAVGSLVYHMARRQVRWRGVITAAAVIATILVVPVPYGVAMKLVAISGVVTLPAAAYAAGRLGGLAYPGPALLAVMTLPFLFDRSFNIYGGNVMSTMAGEFAYSMGLSIAVLYVGVAARGLRTGKGRGLAAGLLALAGLTHLFAAFFGVVASVALFLVRPGRREFSWLAIAGPLAGLLSAFWVLPFAWNARYLNDMGWGKERDYVGALWNRGGNFGGHEFLANELPLEIFVLLAIAGAVISGLRRVRFGMALALIAGMFAVAFFLLPESRLWNVRILPFYYLSIYLLAGVAIAEIGRLVADALRSPDAFRERRPTSNAGIPAVLTMVVVITVLAFPLRSFPFGSLYTDDNGSQEYGFEWAGGLGTTQLNLGPGWMRYNFTGYEQRAAADEYRDFVATMDQVGDTFGCGQSLWEYDGDRLGGYGTPMAPMLLPHWTDGCIGSMEGLYFEASATTPYHFLLQSELSTGPSRAMRDMPYSPLNVDKGVDGLRTMGVRYYMAATEQAIAQGRAQDDLTEIATSGPWVIFMVDGQSVVEGLDHFPVVVDGVDAGGEEWLVPTVAWWEAGPTTPLVAADGPADWPRSSLDELAETDVAYAAAIDADDRVAEMRRLAEIAPEWLERVEADMALVSDIDVGVDTISFEVDRVGTPVLVRTSYFPNWEVAGADGPYRVAPNLMVVVPTDTEVRLSYGRSGIELTSMALTLLGFVGLFLLHRIPVTSRDEALWDLGDSGPDLPGRDDMIEDLRAGVVGAEMVDEIAEQVQVRHAAGLIGVAVSCVLLGLTFFLFAVAKLWSEGLVPGGDKPMASMLVLGPGVVGIVVLFFWALPVVVEMGKYRADVIRPARMIVETLNIDAPPEETATGVFSDPAHTQFGKDPPP